MPISTPIDLGHATGGTLTLTQPVPAGTRIVVRMTGPPRPVGEPSPHATDSRGNVYSLDLVSALLLGETPPAPPPAALVTAILSAYVTVSLQIGDRISAFDGSVVAAVLHAEYYRGIPEADYLESVVGFAGNADFPEVWGECTNVPSGRIACGVLAIATVPPEGSAPIWGGVTAPWTILGPYQDTSIPPNFTLYPARQAASVATPAAITGSLEGAGFYSVAGGLVWYRDATPALPAQAVPGTPQLVAQAA